MWALVRTLVWTLVRTPWAQLQAYRGMNKAQSMRGHKWGTVHNVGGYFQEVLGAGKYLLDRTKMDKTGGKVSMLPFAWYLLK